MDELKDLIRVQKDALDELKAIRKVLEEIKKTQSKHWDLYQREIKAKEKVYGRIIEIERNVFSLKTSLTVKKPGLGTRLWTKVKSWLGR
jgi:DNA-directed RNA polymerase subunit E'/Rpb7